MKTNFLKIAFLFYLGLFYCNLISGQENLKINRSDFKVKEEGFREAWKNLKLGDLYFDMGIKAYRFALKYYLQTYRYDSSLAVLNYKIGLCFLNTDQKTQAGIFLESAFKKKPDIARDIHYSLGCAFQYQFRFDDAIAEFNLYKSSIPVDELEKVTKNINKKIAECRSANHFINKPQRLFIDNFEKVNTSSTDYHPIIAPDESYVFFNSRREKIDDNTINSDTYEYFDDIYFSENNDGTWQEPKPTGLLKNIKGENFLLGPSTDGSIIYFINKAEDIQAYSIKFQSESWISPKAVKRLTDSKVIESCISFSFDNKTAYTCLNKKEDNFGGSDIYYCLRSDNEKHWTKPVNIGPQINTEYDEDGLFLFSDNKTLYFSSKGHNSMGGFDIFKTVYDAEKGWSKPENLGYPINTPDDERFFCMSADGKHAYFSSNRNGGYGGEDIYKVTFLGPKKPLLQSNEDNLLAAIANPVSESIKNPIFISGGNPFIMVKGIIIDQQTFEPVEAMVEVFDNHSKQLITIINSNKKTGKFFFTLPYGKNYGLIFESQGYMFTSENFNLVDSSYTYPKEVDLDVKLQPLQKGAKVILHNVIYNKGATEPVTDSYAELNKVVELMKESPAIKLRITSHTDNVGLLKSSLVLSEKRAKFIAGYLSGKGINTNRLEQMGAAYLKPIEMNSNFQLKHKTSRIEIMVVSE